MATYNGEAYLAQQLRSLQNQTFREWELLIHDDGSSDKTIDIIRSFAKEDKRIKIIEDGIRFSCSELNFMHLLKFSTSPYIAFCDQDDIWLENKLQEMYNIISSSDIQIPQAVYCNSYVYDTGAALISGHTTICHPHKLKDMLFMNGGIQGCAIMFNASLREICNNQPEIIAMHDHLITMAALTFGKLSYIDKRLMLYRRHQNTVTGRTFRNKSEKVTPFFNRNKTVLSPKHYDATISFYNKYKSIIPDKQKKIFNDFFKFTKENKLKRICHIIYGGYNLYDNKLILALKMCIRPLL